MNVTTEDVLGILIFLHFNEQGILFLKLPPPQCTFFATWRSSLFDFVLFSSLRRQAVETVSFVIFLSDWRTELTGFEVLKPVFLSKRFTMSDCEREPPWQANRSETRAVLAGSQMPALKSSVSTWCEIEIGMISMSLMELAPLNAVKASVQMIILSW